MVIVSQAPGFGGVFARSPLMGRLVTRMHVTTAPAVIRNFVLLRKGERCSPLLRSESERILRAMPFIADANVTAYRDGMDGVRVEVVTVDEPSLIGSVGLENDAPFLTGLTVGTQNLLGNAVFASASWRDGFFYRDRYAGRYTNYQLFGKPYQLQLAAARRELGGDWEAEVAYPFLTDVQKSAWRVSGGEIDEYARFLRPGGTPSSLEVKRRFADAGAMLRVGSSGLLGLLGAQLSYEANAPSSAPVLVTDSGLTADTTSSLIGRYRTSRSARVNMLLGLRRVRFVRVTGFDALNGPSADLTWGGGWSARIPYQLDLGARRGGLRGYDDVELGGARRVITRIEERWRIGNFRGTADAGVGVFTDFGRVWAGDVPLGLNSGFRQSVGFSVMAAVPPRSQRMWRLDLAVPIDRRDGSRWGVRLTNEDRTRAFFNSPGDVRRIRERVLPQSIFNWP
ncbi:MAG: hypothetical protein IPF47_05675 [Gemmatimonadetes bacterium]|nr:hypothetical protein [Gemmatimonadota bacterium]